MRKELQAEQLSISKLELMWQGGFKIDVGLLTFKTSRFSVQDTYAELSYSAEQLFRGGLAPELRLSGGLARLRLDSKQERAKQGYQPVNVSVLMHDMQFEWVMGEERRFFQHANLKVSPYQTHISFEADGVRSEIVLNELQVLRSLHLQLSDFSGLPESWLQYVTKLDVLNVSLRVSEQREWQWEVDARAHDGLIVIPEGNIKVPFSEFNATGNLTLQDSDNIKLQSFEATQIQMKDGEDFVMANMSWQQDLFQVEVSDGATTMPMLWSWLQQLGDDAWHKWLNSMSYGRLHHIQGRLSLPWQEPLRSTPSEENFHQLSYDVQAIVEDADVALGLGGDFLTHVDAMVEVNQERLTAKVVTSEFRDGIGNVQGDYTINWNTLMMDIEAQGEIDVGKLHAWLATSSAQEVRWGAAPAHATMSMKWQVEQDLPEVAKLYLKPTPKGWILSPKDTPLHLHRGVVVWDINRGLDLKDVRIKSPWLTGDVTMFLNKDDDWGLSRLHLNGFASLATLTEQFALPIIEPTGMSKLILDFEGGKWRGALNFTDNGWESFSGHEKQAKQVLHVHLSGQQMTKKVLPIQVDSMSSSSEGFQFKSSVLIDQDKLDFRFQDIHTPALQGSFRLLLPLDQARAWGLEARADYMDKSLLAAYLQDTGNPEDHMVRPWSVTVDVKNVSWDQSKAGGVYFKFSSRRQSAGHFSANTFSSGEVSLENVNASFTILDEGKIDLHILEADGSDQHLTISGSVVPKKTGALQWQGIALMHGKFGRLMQQAELDQLFQEGEMTALFLGKGEFKENEPWWRGMEGSFHLRVDDGRVMEGGTLTHLLAALSLMDMPSYIALQRDDVTGTGLLYKRMQVEAEFDEEILSVDRLIFRSSALDASGTGTVDLSNGIIDVLLVARPWQNIEAIVGSIPLIGYVLTGEDKSFLRKVYRIHGPASNADVDELNPKDAGLPNAGLLEELLSLPSDFLEDEKK